MGLVTAKEVAKAINADKYGFLGTFSGWLLVITSYSIHYTKLYDAKRRGVDSG